MAESTSELYISSSERLWMISGAAFFLLLAGLPATGYRRQLASYPLREVRLRANQRESIPMKQSLARSGLSASFNRVFWLIRRFAPLRDH